MSISRSEDELLDKLFEEFARRCIRWRVDGWVEEGEWRGRDGTGF